MNHSIIALLFHGVLSVLNDFILLDSLYWGSQGHIRWCLQLRYLVLSVSSLINHVLVLSEILYKIMLLFNADLI